MIICDTQKQIGASLHAKTTQVNHNRLTVAFDPHFFGVELPSSPAVISTQRRDRELFHSALLVIFNSGKAFQHQITPYRIKTG